MLLFSAYSRAMHCAANLLTTVPCCPQTEGVLHICSMPLRNTCHTHHVVHAAALISAMASLHLKFNRPVMRESAFLCMGGNLMALRLRCKTTPQQLCLLHGAELCADGVHDGAQIILDWRRCICVLAAHALNLPRVVCHLSSARPQPNPSPTTLATLHAPNTVDKRPPGQL